MVEAVCGILLAAYLLGGAISATWFTAVGVERKYITTARELLEVVALTWIIWPLILVEEIYLAIRDRERRRIARARSRE